MIAKSNRARKPYSIAQPSEDVRRELEELERNAQRQVTRDLSDPVWVEHRLRFGIYGQRQDGVHMLRSKLPLGIVDAEQLEAFADVAERFGQPSVHLTTRQDIQLHFVPLEATPELLHRLDAVDATTREACGNVVRNVTASPVAGVEAGEAFDVTPHGLALARYLLRHPDAQSLGRKFKVHLTGSEDPAHDLTAIHDIGLTARVEDGRKGFRVRVGGGLGAVAYEAQEYTPFLPADELLPFTHAVLRVFAVNGEKRKRARARLKFLIANWGLDRFREAVERARREEPDLGARPDSAVYEERPTLDPGSGFPVARQGAEARWLRTNVTLQRQHGYASVRVRVPRGDLAPKQLRGLAALLREHAGPTLRVTPDQDLLLRWVPLSHLIALHDGLAALDLALANAGGLGDTVTCPGADTCKLGITSPRALDRALQPVLDELAQEPRLEGLRIHVSGCPNSCAQHQLADIGLFGAARTVAGISVPHYQLLLGGRGAPSGVDEELGSGFGRVVTKLPAGRVPEAVRRIAHAFLHTSAADESFRDFVARRGRDAFKALLADLQQLPDPSDSPELYREPGSSTPFRIRRGVGECAGAAVDASDLLLAAAERAAEGAEDALEAQDVDEARARAREAMHEAARGLLAADHVTATTADEVRQAFHALVYVPGKIFEGVGHTYLAAFEEPDDALRGDRLRRLVVEARLFVEEAHAMLSKARERQGGEVAS